MDLEYEHIPQYQYTIEGIPAKDYGEWGGKTSSKWKGSIRVIHPISRQKIFKDDSPLQVKNRRHFSALPTKEKNYTVGKRLFTERKFQENIEDKKVGLKKVNQNVTQGKIWFQKRHFEEQFGINYDPEVFHIRTFYPDGNTRTFKEISIEKELGKKKQITSLIQRRNEMLIRAPGDKHYKQSEYLTGYFHEGGLVPGSTNVLNLRKTQSKKSNNYYDTLDINAKTLDVNKLWWNKVKSERKQFDCSYVQNISNWEKNILNDYLPHIADKQAQAPKGGSQPSNAKVPATQSKNPVPPKKKKE